MDSDEDLELLLSFQNGECIPETPPHSPLPHPPESEKSFRSFGMSHMKHTYVANVQRVVCSPRSGKREMVRSAIPKVQKLGYHSDEDLPKPRKSVSMAVFKDVVSSSMEKIVDIKPGLPVRQAMCPANGIDIEKHSGLRIKNRLISCANLSTRLLELRFVRLQAIRTAMMGESMMGAWATVGVLAEKGNPKTSTTGKNFTIWKLSSLDTSTISVFLFGDAYVQHWKESAGSIVVLFNAKARRDEKRNEYILSVFSSDQVMKVGTSVDYSICKGIRKDGTPCTVVVDRRHGNFCQYHNAKNRQKYTTKRGELSGGNLATGFADPLKSRGAQVIKTITESIFDSKPLKPVKHMTSNQLKKVLSNADKVTTKSQSQGIRFLASLAEDKTENLELKAGLKRKQGGGLEPSKKRVVEDPKTKKEIPVRKEENRENSFFNQASLIELDLEGPDDAMVQAMSLFREGGLV